MAAIKQNRNFIMVSKARLAHIDNAKAIGMMLIVASHIVPTKEVVDSVLFQTWNGLINSFYVPLFFILSGVFQSSSTDYKKLGRRMLILIRYCAIFYVFGIITDGLINGNWSLSPHKPQYGSYLRFFGLPPFLVC